MAFVRFILVCSDIFNDFLNKNCPYLASAIAFWTLFSIFPLFLAVISVLGFVLGPQAEEEKLAKEMATVLPVSSDYISQTIQGVVSARAVTGLVSILGLLWAATAAFGAIRKGINAAWGIKKTRPFLQERLIDFALVIGAGLMLLAVLFSGPVLSLIQQFTADLSPNSEMFTNFIWDLSFPVATFLTFLLLTLLLNRWSNIFT